MIKAPKKTRFKRKGRGAVLLIALLFTASGLLRVVVGAGSAFAGAGGLAGKNDISNAGIESEIASPDSGKTPMSLDRPAMQLLLDALQGREAKVAAQEKRIATREKALKVADEEIVKRLVALEVAEKDLRATLALADRAAEDDLARLTTVYESMKPKDAAALFESMESDFAAGFIGRMRPDAAASVMAGLSSDAAYAISVILAGRNANAPKT